MNEKVEYEKINLANVFKQNGNVQITINPDCNDFELYGFLKAFVKSFEKSLVDAFEPTEEKDL